MSRKKGFRLIVFILGSLMSNLVLSSIEIDGLLDEEEWKEARKISGFLEVAPFTLKETKYKTEVLIHENEEGIFLGFKSFQPKETMRVQNHERDAWMTNADRVGTIIDFDGDSLTAYEFSVSLGDSLRDVIFRNENDQKADWDADWSAKTSSYNTYWIAEIHIPWSIIPMKAQEGEYRKVKLGFFRQSMAEGKVYSTVRSNPMRQSFLSLLNHFTLRNYSSSKLVFFTY